MSLIELPDMVQGSDAWHAQRRGLVTASALHRLVTARPFGPLEYACPACDAEADEQCRSKVKKAGETGAPIKTAHPERTAVSAANRDGQVVVEVADTKESSDLTALLTAERITGYTDPTYVSDDMLRGIEDEPRAVDHYSEHRAPVRTTGILLRDDWGFTIGFSPDGLVGDDGLIEVKSRRAKKQLTTFVSDTVPAENMAQLMCGLLVSGRKWIDYVSYSGGMPMYVKRVYPDARWFNAILSAVEKFEKASADMIATYNARVEGLPMTERVVDLEMIL